MSTQYEGKDKYPDSSLSLMEAVETLSHIADIDVEHPLSELGDEFLIFQGSSLAEHTVDWLKTHDSAETTHVVKSIFKVILNHLEAFYQDEHTMTHTPHAIDEIKSIMLLVGEAAKKLDKLTRLFHKTRDEPVTSLKEYRDLQDFYRLHIARTIDDGVIGRWILALSQKGGIQWQKPKVILKGYAQTYKKEEESNAIQHVFVDLDSVKKDSDYELFFMRKEDGTRFFNPRLVRNIKLVNDFGSYLGVARPIDPLEGIEVWRSRVAHASAKEIFAATYLLIDKFCHLAMKQKDHDFIFLMNEAVFALLLATNPSSLYKEPLVKDCSGYFADFQQFLSQALQSFDYQKMVMYTGNKPNSWIASALTLIHAFCGALYSQTCGIVELKAPVNKLLEEAKENVSVEHAQSKGCWDLLAADYTAMTKAIKGHPSGPVNKILSHLEDGESHGFSPLYQGHLPSVDYEVYCGEKRYLVTRWPSPTFQESINKAIVGEEFKGFLRDLKANRVVNNCLLVNLQDRLTWKDYYRSQVLEALGKNEEFAPVIEVATLANDTEFYYQQPPYHDINHAQEFIALFKEQLKDSSGGFLIPEAFIKAWKYEEFYSCTLEAIHRIFFTSRNSLTREHRLDFIEIFNLFMLFKLVDSAQPGVIGLCCKDGVDVSSAVSAELFVFLKLLHQSHLNREDYEYLSWIIYAPALLYRERLMIPERFHRMASVIRLIESTQKQFGHAAFLKIIDEAFGYLMDSPLYRGKCKMPE